VRTGPEFGNIFDHHSVAYEFAGGVKVFASCRQQPGCAKDISVYALGSRGTGVVSEHELSLNAGKPWRYRQRKDKRRNMYQIEHDVFFASIRAGKPINHGDYMSKSTLMAIMGRMATYTGQVINWDQAMASEEDLSPPRYEWGALKVAPVAIPGQTRVF
jgi:hypothetical protein